MNVPKFEQSDCHDFLVRYETVSQNKFKRVTK